MPVLFALLPSAAALPELLGDGTDGTTPTRGKPQLRQYPPATDARHLLSLVRAGRDPLATRWRRGMVLAIAFGAGIGLITDGLLASAFHMFGGLLEIALPLGFFLGAFLGGFTAAMTGTEVAREEVRHLAAHVQNGNVLLQVADGHAAIEELAARCQSLGWHCTRIADS